MNNTLYSEFKNEINVLWYNCVKVCVSLKLRVINSFTIWYRVSEFNFIGIPNNTKSNQEYSVPIIDQIDITLQTIIYTCYVTAHVCFIKKKVLRSEHIIRRNCRSDTNVKVLIIRSAIVVMGGRNSRVQSIVITITSHFDSVHSDRVYEALVPG